MYYKESLTAPLSSPRTAAFSSETSTVVTATAMTTILSTTTTPETTVPALSTTPATSLGEAVVVGW
jgi:hypothetical protein